MNQRLRWRSTSTRRNSPFLFLVVAVTACGPSFQQILEQQEQERRRIASIEAAKRVEREHAAENERKAAATHAQAEYALASQALAAARANPEIRAAKLEEAREHANRGLASAAKFTTAERDLKALRENIERESRVAVALESIGRGASPRDACARSESDASARCEREVAEGLLDASRDELDDARAKQLLDHAAQIAASSARRNTRGDNLDFNQLLAERRQLETLVSSINAETARREASKYLKSASDIAVVEVCGPTSQARVDLGSATGSVWCAAEQVRQSLISAGIPETRVLVSAMPSQNRDAHQPGSILINVRPAGREEKIIDAAEACRTRVPRSVSDWQNPFVLARSTLNF